MTTLNLPLEEQQVEALRKQAAAAGKSLETWAAELMLQHVVKPQSESWLDEYVALARQAGGNSRGWKWNREELYDE